MCCPGWQELPRLARVEESGLCLVWQVSGMRIITIEKLNVPDMADAYDLILKQMERRERKREKAGKAHIDQGKLELRWTFHSCAAENVDNIICGGFNRSYAGKNATKYGVGSYFARVRLSLCPRPRTVVCLLLLLLRSTTCAPLNERCACLRVPRVRRRTLPTLASTCRLRC